ncbi:hypothetical protein SH528x_005278 [Novipirellula sp. SH528]|uniref:hypothetical protein n=1 Tax=Novipirellula sp. SH528 TaxID=3454466 RepID=UPI003F9F5559
MKNVFLVCVAIICLSSFSLVGCGSGTSTKVVDVPPQSEPEMTPEEEAEYAKAMRESMK